MLGVDARRAYGLRRFWAFAQTTPDAFELTPVDAYRRIRALPQSLDEWRRRSVGWVQGRKVDLNTLDARVHGKAGTLGGRRTLPRGSRGSRGSLGWGADDQEYVRLF